MLKNINEYSISVDTGVVQQLYLPVSSQIVDVRKTSTGVSLIVLSDLSSDNQLRFFQVCTPNSNIFAKKAIYLGNFEDDCLGILYVLEVIN
jgi:hypothetical protein